MLLLVVLSTVMSSVPAGAQVREALATGTRIRVWLTSQPQALEGAAAKQHLRGTLTSYTADSLTVSIHPGAAPLTVAWPAVSRVDQSRGVPSRLTSAVWRGLQTSALGAVEFAVLDRADGRFGSTGKAMLVGAATGAGLGILWGALFPQERWSRIRLERP